jgi:hypothetical protein
VPGLACNGGVCVAAAIDGGAAGVDSRNPADGSGPTGLDRPAGGDLDVVLPASGSDGGADAPLATDGGASEGDFGESCTGGVCTDFPGTPIFDEDVSPNAAESFTGPATGNGPCVLEPEDGTIIPYNWLRPRISWSGSGLHQITITTRREQGSLIAYTNGSTWAMPASIWHGLATHIRDEDITVAIREVSGATSRVSFRIAPAAADGSIVYFAAAPARVGNMSLAAITDQDYFLAGFSPGEEGVVTALKMSTVKQPSRQQSWNQKRTAQCIGCHVATPDSGYLAFVDHWPWNSVIANITPDNVGAPLPNLGDGGLLALNKPWAGMPAFSKAFWDGTRRYMVTTSSQRSDDSPWSTDNREPAKLVYYDLNSAAPAAVNGQIVPRQGQQYFVIARNNDPHFGAAFPSWSHDGNTIVYCSTSGANMDGRLEKGATDLYAVPFNNGQGGDAKPLMGAATAEWEEYYPAFSPDDAFVAFDRVTAGTRMYNNTAAELFVIPSVGGDAHRLRANDPPACSTKKSPGLNNLSPKWSPSFTQVGNRKFYWVVFSSNRAGLPPVKSPYKQEDQGMVQISQVYIAAIVVEGDKITSYPAIYLWNQATTTTNLTPAWDMLAIPKLVL